VVVTDLGGSPAAMGAAADHRNALLRAERDTRRRQLAELLEVQVHAGSGTLSAEPTIDKRYSRM
jgi:hypothetical protein